MRAPVWNPYIRVDVELVPPLAKLGDIPTVETERWV